MDYCRVTFVESFRWFLEALNLGGLQYSYILISASVNDCSTFMATLAKQSGSVSKQTKEGVMGTPLMGHFLALGVQWFMTQVRCFLQTLEVHLIFQVIFRPKSFCYAFTESFAPLDGVLLLPESEENRGYIIHVQELALPSAGTEISEYFYAWSAFLCFEKFLLME